MKNQLLFNQVFILLERLIQNQRKLFFQLTRLNECFQFFKQFSYLYDIENYGNEYNSNRHFCCAYKKCFTCKSKIFRKQILKNIRVTHNFITVFLWRIRFEKQICHWCREINNFRWKTCKTSQINRTITINRWHINAKYFGKFPNYLEHFHRCQLLSRSAQNWIHDIGDFDIQLGKCINNFVVSHHYHFIDISIIRIYSRLF